MPHSPNTQGETSHPLLLGQLITGLEWVRADIHKVQESLEIVHTRLADHERVTGTIKMDLAAMRRGRKDCMEDRQVERAERLVKFIMALILWGVNIVLAWKTGGLSAVADLATKMLAP